MPVTRTRLAGAAAAAAVALAAVGGVVLAARPERAEPSAEVIAARDLLAAPSVVGPLPGSTQLSDTRFQYPGTCADARAAYLAPGAPTPPEATLTEQGSAIVVTQPWAISGVLFVDGGGTCRYDILAAPTATIASTFAAIPSGQSFGRAICGEPDGEDDTFGVIVETVVDAVPHLLVIGEGEVALAPGSLTDLASLGAEPPPLDAQVTAEGTMESGFTATVTAPDGSVATITGVCTGSIFELLPA